MGEDVKARRARKSGRARAGGAGVLKRLRQAERRYEMAMGAINESPYEWDLARDRMFYSENMERTLGLPSGALKTLKDWHERVHPDDFPRFREATIAHLKGVTERLRCDYRYRTLDGTWRWARTHGLALRDPRGRAVRMVGSTGDITELKRVEEALRQSEERYALALRAVNEGLYEWNIAEGTTYYSERVYEAVGLSADDFSTPGDWRSRIHPEDLPRYDAGLVAHFKGKTERFECDYRYRTKDGSWRWARQHGVAVRNQDGRAVRMIGSTGDITELKQAEEALRKSEERYALATSAAVEGIYEWDLETGTLFLTERAKAFFSFPAEALTPAAWNARVHGEDYPGYRAAILDHFKGRTPQMEHEYRIADGRGGYKWVLDRGIAVRNARGRVTKMVGALSDITQRKLSEIELRRARDRAEEALEQQTATAEVLRVMSESQTDVRPVFDAIARSAVRLCEGLHCSLFRFEDGLQHFVAHHGVDAQTVEDLQRRYPRAPTPATVTGRAILERVVIQLEDVCADPRFPESHKIVSPAGYRAVLAVPMLKEGQPIGVIFVVRREARRFSDKQIELLRTFADQAVIAIENVRLFNETRESLEQQKASGEVLRAISSSIADTAPVFDKILESCQRLFAGRIVGLNLVRDDGMIHIGAYHGAHREQFERIFPLPLNRDSGSGLCILERRVVHYPDAEEGAEVPAKTRQGCKTIGIKSVIFAPLLWEGRGMGAIFVGRDHVSSFSDKEIALLRTFADQAVIAIENVRLFNEIQDKSRELEVASRHKSEFLANMSHELRTPLNAIIGFTRIVMRRSQESLEPKQYENLEKILASGEHLLALINSILDLSKIEAGRIEIKPGEVRLAPVLEQCIRTVEPLVKADTVTLLKEFEGELPQVYTDEEKLRQIVINLLSNAVRFTEQGSVRLRAHAANGSVAIAVTDTGIGIPPDKLEVIFEEFEQADASSTRVHGGTGLGLAIARRLARLMGGEITAESVLGSGSTFRLTLPLRYGAPQ
jgi:PAS domain S-box-containing protein